jgi:hypothetical protein
MTIEVIAEADVMREVTQVLLENLSPATVARFWASWHMGQGYYLDWRDEQFKGETVTSLYEKILAFQEARNETSESGS